MFGCEHLGRSVGDLAMPRLSVVASDRDHSKRYAELAILVRPDLVGHLGLDIDDIPQGFLLSFLESFADEFVAVFVVVADDPRVG